MGLHRPGSQGLVFVFVSFMTNIKVTNMRNYSREIFQEVGLQRPGSQGVQSTRRWPPPLTTSASFYLSPTLCSTNPPRTSTPQIYAKMYLSKWQTVFVQMANCICPNGKLYLFKLTYFIRRPFVALLTHLQGKYMVPPHTKTLCHPLLPPLSSIQKILQNFYFVIAAAVVIIHFGSSPKLDLKSGSVGRYRRCQP